MKRKVLCAALALLMCLTLAAPTFADGERETPERTDITAAFGLTHVSGSTYKMWARIINVEGASVFATLCLYDAAYKPVKYVYTVSSNTLISMNKNVTLSSGTYYLRLTYTAEGVTYSTERAYHL